MKKVKSIVTIGLVATTGWLVAAGSTNGDKDSVEKEFSPDHQAISQALPGAGTTTLPAMSKTLVEYEHAVYRGELFVEAESAAATGLESDSLAEKLDALRIYRALVIQNKFLDKAETVVRRLKGIWKTIKGAEAGVLERTRLGLLALLVGAGRAYEDANEEASIALYDSWETVGAWSLIRHALLKQGRYLQQAARECVDVFSRQEWDFSLVRASVPSLFLYLKERGYGVEEAKQLMPSASNPYVQQILKMYDIKEEVNNS